MYKQKQGQRLGLKDKQMKKTSGNKTVNITTYKRDRAKRKREIE